MKKFKTLLLLIALNLLPQLSFSQLVHLELGGAGLIYSVNLDSRFSSKTNLGFRVGLGIFQDDRTFFFAPIQINYVTAGEYGIEIGAGLTVVNSVQQLRNGGQLFSGIDDSGLYTSVTLAYRFQTTKPLNFRVGITTLLNADLTFPWSIFYPTLSVGHQF